MFVNIVLHKIFPMSNVLNYNTTIKKIYIIQGGKKCLINHNKARTKQRIAAFSSKSVSKWIKYEVILKNMNTYDSTMYLSAKHQ